MGGLLRLLLALSPLLLGCKGDDAPAGDGESSGAGSGGGSGGGEPIMCTPGVEFALEDGIGLGAISVDALRTQQMDGVVDYDVYIHGDDTDVSQLTVEFQGIPQVGLPYVAAAVPQPNKPVLGIYPMVDEAPLLTGGTVTYTEVGVVTGDLLTLGLQLQFTSGTLEGCISAALVASGGG